MTITFGAYYVARYTTFNKFFIAFYEPQEFFVVFIYLFIIIIIFCLGGGTSWQGRRTVLEDTLSAT